MFYVYAALRQQVTLMTAAVNIDEQHVIIIATIRSDACY